MRKAIVVVAVSAALAGCGGLPTWMGGRPTNPEPPVSMPTSAIPATQPAEAPGAPAAPTAPPVPVDVSPAVPIAPPAPEPEPADLTAGEPTAGPVSVPPTPPIPPEPTPAPKSVPTPTPVPAPEPTPEAAPTPVPTPVPAPKPVPPRPAPADAGGPVMAYVNDRPIYMATLNRLLVSGYGMGIAQQLIANELVLAEAARQGVSVTDEEVQAEHERTLREMFENVEDANQRQRLLKQLLVQRNTSQEHWDLTMRRHAILGKLADKNLTITEEELQDEFGRQYERKVEVRHIQTATLADAQRVIRELASGEDFSAVVAKYSVGPSAKAGGVLAPFGGKSTGTPAPIREVALEMRKIGEVSDPIQIGTAFHVIKLVRIIEPQDVRFEDVKDGLLLSVRKRKLAAMRTDILQILIRGARVRYVNPVLKAQDDEGHQP